MKSSRGTLTTLGILLVMACGDIGTDGGALPIQTWTLDSVATARIGGHDERSDYLLERTMGATRLSDGRIAIADGGASNVRIFSADGTHLATHGREGQGPGEFQNLFQMQKGPGDELIVLSLRPGLTFMDADEGPTRQESFSIWGFQVECRFAESNWNVLPSGALWFVFEETGSCGPTREGAHRNTGLIMAIDPNTNSMDTIALMPATERDDINYRAFGHMLTLGFGANRVYLGDTGADSIVVLGFDGERIGALAVPFESQPVPPEAISEPIRRWTNPQTGEERVGAPYDYPDALPPYGKLVAGPDNTLWVKAYPTRLEAPISSYQVDKIWSPFFQPGGSDWRVLDVTGRVIAEAHLPERFVLLEVGDDYVLGVERDEFDVETVVVYPLRKPTET